jgi:two-component sensor histidine kinase
VSDFASDADPHDEGGSKKRLADVLIRVCAALGVLAYIPSAYLSWKTGLLLILGADSAALAYILVLALVPSLPYRLKVISLSVLSYGLGLALLIVVGPFGAGHLYLFCFVILAGLFGGVRILVAANLLCAASYAGFAVFATRAHPLWSQVPGSVVVISANALMLGAVLSAAANYLVRRYAAAAVAERRLRRLRETMLREIDHRVKNNLQMLSSLVSLRSRSGADPAKSLDAIRESLSAIMLVHQLLDREGTHYSLKTGRFLAALFERFGSSYPDLSFEYRWKGPEIEVDGDVGIDLGVMINEIVANSVKHAFPGRQGGKVFLEARAEEGTRRLVLVVGDDGIGGGERGGSWGSASTMDASGQGLKIVDALAKHLGAEMKVDAGRGFVYEFKLLLAELENRDHA